MYSRYNYNGTGCVKGFLFVSNVNSDELLAQIVEEVKQDVDKTAERLVEEMMSFVTKDTTKEQLLQVLQSSYEQLMEKENRPQAVYAGRGSYRRSSEKIGRNDPCPCGSGKKYKQCCGKA